jgi:hypothetical protein
MRITDALVIGHPSPKTSDEGGQHTAPTLAVRARPWIPRPLSAYADRAGDGVRVRAPQRRGEAFAALLSDIAGPDLTWRWPTVAEWSRQVPLLVRGQSR